MHIDLKKALSLPEIHRMISKRDEVTSRFGPLFRNPSKLKRQDYLDFLSFEQCPKVGDGVIGWHIMAVLKRRDSRREKDMPHERRYDFAAH